MQKNYKKLLVASALFINVVLYGEDSLLNTDLGRNRVLEIMNNGPEGLVSSYKNVICAETVNLASDIDLAEVTQRFNCQTIVGHEFLEDAFNKLISPKNTTTLLADRQHAISVIVKNEQLRNELHDLLQEAAEHEAAVIKFMQQKQSVLENLPKGSFSKGCVKSPVVQGLNQLKWAGVGAAAGYGLHTLYENRDNLFAKKPAIIAGIESKIDEYAIVPMQNHLKDISGKVEDFNKVDRSTLPVGFVRDMYDQEKQKHEEAELAFKKLISLGEDAKSELYTYAGSINTAAYIMATTGVAILAYSTYQMYLNHLEGLKVRDCLYSINQLIVIAEKIEILCAQYNIENQFVMSAITNKDNRVLINKLKAYRYSNNYSFFVASSLTRTFMYEVYEKDMHLAPVFASIAEMDSLCSIANKMVSTKNAKNKFCFVRFVEQDKPFIAADNFWNILVKNAVANNFEDYRNVILTGPNAGGKSTSIRAILQNIVFGQTFGFAAASSFELTQFDIVHSFINVSDDILGGKSLFATEIQRAQDIMQRIKKMSQNEKYFFALDELFTGTNAEDGEMCAYAFIENIAQYSQTQFIYATHFNRLKDIGATNENCVNYKINAPAQDDLGLFIRDNKGKLMYPYTMSLGANHISVAKEIAHDAGLIQ